MEFQAKRKNEFAVNAQPEKIGFQPGDSVSTLHEFHQRTASGIPKMRVNMPEKE